MIFKLIVGDIKESFEKNKFEWLLFTTAALLFTASLIFPWFSAVLNMIIGFVIIIIMALFVISIVWLTFRYVKNLIKRVKNKTS